MDNEQPTHDAELRDWSVTNLGGRLIAFGRIYGDRKGRFADGTEIRTSLVQSVTGDILQTRNTTYRLGEPA